MRFSFFGSGHSSKMDLGNKAEERGAIGDLRFGFLIKWYAKRANTMVERLDDALPD